MYARIVDRGMSRSFNNRYRSFEGQRIKKQTSERKFNKITHFN